MPWRTAYRRMVLLALRCLILARNLAPEKIALGALAILMGIYAVFWLYSGTGISLPILADATPMLLAVVGIIMSYVQPKKENHNLTTAVLITAGLISTGILSWNRLRTEAAHLREVQQLNTKIATVQSQNTTILQTLTTAGIGGEKISETERRRNIEKLLRNEYILSHNPIDPNILAGNAMPPPEWMNQRLKQMGENWQFINVESGAGTIAGAMPKALVIGKITSVVAPRAGEAANISLKIQVNHKSALEVKRQELGAVSSVDSDPAKQRAIEDGLWNMMLGQPEGPPAQIPSHSEDVGFSITTGKVADANFAAVGAGTFEYYFMCRIVDLRKVVLLDFCAHVDSKGNLLYCRAHNGP